MKYLAFLVLILGLPLLAFAQGNTDTSFVPLTNIPFLTETGNAFSLETFLNGLYRLSIGIAAVVAVLQIMRAGIMYMGGDSVTEKKEAKNLIALSIGGLILVLSPVVVFSIINPEILSLRIGNIEALTPEPTASTTTVPVVLPSTEQGVCSVTYLELGRSQNCSAAGPNWEQAAMACCSSIPGGGFCCGRKPSAPPPDSTDSWSYTIAVKNTEQDPSTLLNRSCIAYEQGTDSNVSACGLKTGTRTQQLDAAGKDYVVTHECNGTTRPLGSLSGLPTCS